MKMLVMILAAILTAGCAQEQYTADGRKEMPIECSGPTKAWGLCYEQAKQLCGASGYDVISKSGDAANVTTEKNLINQNSGAVTLPSPRTMVIACRTPPAP